jgi:multisubunit Na+/H+ antiporter MnhB subunit
MKTLDSFILRAVTGVIFLLVNIVSVYLLLRGHNLPGGGFIAGLATGISFILLGLALGWEELERTMPFESLRLATVGVAIAVFSGLLPLVQGAPFLTHYHFHFERVPLLGELHAGTPLLFDLGVFLVVVGITIKLVIVLARSTSGLPPFSEREARLYASALEEPIEDQIRGEQHRDSREERPHAN